MGIRTEEIYEALFDDAAFARLPDLLAQAGNGRSAMLLWQHSDGLSQALAYNYFPEAMMNHYGARWAPADPWVIGGAKSGRQNEMVLLEQYVSPVAFERSVFYNEFIRKEHDDTFHCLGGIINSAWGQGVISVQKGRSSKAFDLQDARKVQNVAVHVERVLRARGELASARRAATFAQGALDAAGLVAITVRADGRILHSNAIAETVLRRAEGLALRDGKLVATAHETAKKLTHALAAATAVANPGAMAVVVPRGPLEAAYLLTITPLVGRMGEAAALVLFRDPAVQDNSLADHLRMLFNLTPAEAAVAVDMAQGMAFADIARSRGVRVSTLRAQFRAIGAKTGCRRQSQLIALIRRLPPGGAQPALSEGQA